jgi:DNA modification methylase
MDKLKWHTEKRKVDDVIPYERNPRQMTEAQKNDLQRSLEKFDLVEIPAINTDNKIVAGHQRLKILQLLGRGSEEIDVRVPNRKMTDKEFEEYNLRSNKNVGEWNYDLLANFDEEILKDIGFKSEELDKIFNLDADKDIDDVPEPPEEPKSKLGEIYQLGEHRLMCGDSTNKEDIEMLIGTEKVKLVFTSPPYNMAGGMYEDYEDNLKSEEYINFNINVIKNIKPYLMGFIFWNLSYNKNARWEFMEIFNRIVKETRLKFLEMICWDKGHALPITSKEGLTRQYEDIILVGEEDIISRELELYFLGRNNSRAYFNKKNQRGITNYWRIGTNRTQIKGNLACFPVALPKKGIELMTDRNDIVLDPFGGSGSTLIACEQLNRKCYMMELDPKYCDVIINRFEKLTGKKANKIE